MLDAVEVLDRPSDTASFFAPVSADVIDGLLGQYEAMRRRVERIHAAMTDDAAALGYFLEGNSGRHEYSASAAVGRLLDLGGAIKALDAAYWSKALGLTDVYECMPKARRDEWDKQVREMTTPPFTEDAVRPTMLELLRAREKFFAERVDGIFRGLSGEHVTNCPEAFGKRMIIAHVFSEFGSTDHSRAGLITDFRAVIGKFMGRTGEPRWSDTADLLKQARHHRGEWLSCDGGSWRLRCYKVGTAHLEVHPDMAWRLNCVLAQLYPLAIPAEFRQKPKKKLRDFVMMGQPLPFEVSALLGDMEEAREWYEVPNRFEKAARRIPNTRRFRYSGCDPNVLAQAEKVLQSIGGVKAERGGHYVFDFDPADALHEIAATGCLPDRVAHQFYPTPASIAQVCAELADIGAGDAVLEPSAGQGDLAAFLPKDRTTCVEISALHCAVLKAKGFNTIEGDFLVWADLCWPNGPFFDRVLMNPPFSDGRAKLHTEMAASLVAAGGRLVAVLPASMKGKAFLGGSFDHEWSRVYDNEFAGTSVSVVILTASKKGQA